MPETITDTKGRVFTLREFTVLDQVRIMRAIGAEQSQNAPYTSVVMQVCSVSEIDGVPVPMPRNERDIDALIGRIGDDGFAVLIVHTMKKTEEMREAAEAALAGQETPADPLAQSAA